MLRLPPATQLNKPLPKTAIYAKFGWNAAQQERFDADISRITIVNEVSPATTAIAAGDTVASFYLVAVSLKQKRFDVQHLVSLSQLIPQKMVFVLTYETELMLAAYHTQLLCSEWCKADEANLTLKGLNLDAVYENLLREIAGTKLQLHNGGTLAEDIAEQQRRAKIERKIAQLEAKRRKETQFNKQLVLSAEIKKLKEQL